ncbi:hypothetical protein [Saccharopolyspora hattusasensis]|uniref:hypothetical protein n=1 Tax=Saccharopolyspora hattusasensis TaxID=1128679 RepID=UPI003D972EA7
MADSTWQYFQNPENRRRILARTTDQDAADALDIAALRAAPDAPEPATATNLDAQIRERIEWAYEEPHAWGHGMFDALRAVLDLHRPDHGSCRECGVDAYENEIPWPCTTVRAISKTIGVEP